MRRLTIGGDAPLRVVAIGAHPDDIEIGCGGTLLRLAGEERLAAMTWAVMCAHGERAAEARAGIASFGAGVPDTDIRLGAFRDGYLPASYEAVKDAVADLEDAAPDLVLVPGRDDAHQDHRLLGELAATVFRDHLILEYEIPKYDGDLHPMNTYVDVADDLVSRKIEILMTDFPSQRERSWYTPDTFRSILRLRGIECRSPSGYAEAFLARKILL